MLLARNRLLGHAAGCNRDLVAPKKKKIFSWNWPEQLRMYYGYIIGMYYSRIAYGHYHRIIANANAN